MLLLQENFWYAALASVGDAVIVTDARGYTVFLNPVAERLCGWELSEAKNQPLPCIFQIVNEKTRRAVENPVDKVFREGVVVGLANHTILISRQGIETGIDDSAAPILDDGKVMGVVLVFRDVADKRRIDELNQRLAAIVESSDDIIATKDLQGIITSWNPGARPTRQQFHGHIKP
jgi:PAS domain S-box-containing protein